MRKILLFLGIFAVSSFKVQAENTPGKAKEQASVAQSGWVYTTTKSDGLDEVPIKGAVLQSKNSLSLYWPYDGINYGTLYIRKWGDNDIEVALGLDKGNFIDPEHGSILREYIRTVFDQKDRDRFAIERVGKRGLRPGLVVITGTNSFLSQLQGSKTLKIEVKIRKEGLKVLEFDVAGFDLSKLE